GAARAGARRTLCPVYQHAQDQGPRAARRASAPDNRGKSADALMEAARSPVHLSGAGGSTGHQQSGRAAIETGGDCAQNLLRQQNWKRSPGLAGVGLVGRNLPAEWSLRPQRHFQSRPAPARARPLMLKITLNRYQGEGESSSYSEQFAAFPNFDRASKWHS